MLSRDSVQKYVALPTEDIHSPRSLPVSPGRSERRAWHLSSFGQRVARAPTPPRRGPSKDLAVQVLDAAVFVEDRSSHTPVSLTEFESEILRNSSSSSVWRFVEWGCFQGFAAFVIILNIVTMILETDKPWRKDTFFWLDQLMMVFYVFELFCRSFYFRQLFLCGRFRLVIWNVLDLVVVTAGVVDQWLMPLLPDSCKGERVEQLLTLLRLLRIFRTLKIMRIFLESDLSWTEEPRFQSFIGVVIAFNALLMGMETDVDWYGWFYIEQVLLTIYLFELSVRLKKNGCHFLSCYNPDVVWNWLDFVIVVSSTLDTWVVPLIGILVKAMLGPAAARKTSGGMQVGQVMMLMRMLRLMRILRLVKLVKSVRPLFILVTGVLAALQGVMWVLVLTITVLYAMGIMATRLIGHGMLFPEGHVPDDILVPFRTVPDSMFTLFRVMSGASSDEEAVAIDDLMQALPSVKFAFVFFMISSSWTLLSILTAVVSENMISTTEAQQEKMMIASAEEDRVGHIEQLKDLFKVIDASGDGIVDQNELDEFLADKSNSLATAECCRVPARDVKEVLKTLHMNFDQVTMNDFVESLVDVRHQATEKSVMKIEARLTKLQLRLETLLEKLETKAELHHATEREEIQQHVGASTNAILDRLREQDSTNLDRLREQDSRSETVLLALRGTLDIMLDAHIEALHTKMETTLGSLEQRRHEAEVSLQEVVKASTEVLRLQLDGLASNVVSISSEQEQKSDDMAGNFRGVMQVSLETVLAGHASIEAIFRDWALVHGQKQESLAKQNESITPLLAKHGAISVHENSGLPLRSTEEPVVHDAYSCLQADNEISDCHADSHSCQLP